MLFKSLRNLPGIFQVNFRKKKVLHNLYRTDYFSFKKRITRTHVYTRTHIIKKKNEGCAVKIIVVICCDSVSPIYPLILKVEFVKIFSYRNYVLERKTMPKPVETSERSKNIFIHIFVLYIVIFLIKNIF